jgi:hypothetical protein
MYLTLLRPLLLLLAMKAVLSSLELPLMQGGFNPSRDLPT